jgi:hypothetical protein
VEKDKSIEQKFPLFITLLPVLRCLAGFLKHKLINSVGCFGHHATRVCTEGVLGWTVVAVLPGDGVESIDPKW